MMKNSSNYYGCLILGLAAMLSTPLANAESWSATRGGPKRTGVRSGSAQLDRPQETWKLTLGGQLPPQSVWVLEPADPAVLVAAGGRIVAKAWDDVVTWRSELVRANQILAVIDVDSDGSDDTIVATRNGVAGTLVLLNMDGTIRWQAPRDLGEIHHGVRIADLNGDGYLDLLTASYGGGGPGIHAFSLRPITAAPTLLWKDGLENRDYKAGFFDIIGEFDGSPGLELLSQGHHYFYLHDAATGTLEQTSERLAPLPYGRATVQVADLDGDGISEVVAFSNEQWAPPANRRHVSAYSWRNGVFTELWSQTLASENDRLGFSDQSLADIDGDGSYEVTVSVYDSESSSWRLEVRNAGTGELLATQPGRRLSTVVTIAEQPYLATQDKDGPLELFQFQRDAGLHPRYTADGYQLAMCRVQTKTIVQRSVAAPCTAPNGDILLFSRDADNQRRSVSLLSSLSTLPEIHYTPDTGSIVGFWVTHESEPTAFAIATSTGKLQPLSPILQVPPPTVDPPYSWSGVAFGSATQSGNFARFPLSYRSSDADTTENLLVILGDREAVAIAPSQATSVTAEVPRLWSYPGADRIALSGGEKPTKALIFDEQKGISAVSTTDGSLQWTRLSLLDQQDGLRLHHAPLMVGSEIWFHRSHSGSYLLTSLASDSGTTVFDSVLSTNNSGWRRLSLITNSDLQPVVAAGPIREIWHYGDDGTASSTYSSTAAAMVVDVNNAWLQISSINLEQIKPDGSPGWSLDVDNSQTKLGAVLTSNDTQQYIAALGAENQLMSVDTATGSITWTLQLANGAVVDETEGSPPSLGNSTAVEMLSPTIGPAVLVGGSDGFLYAVAANDGTLAWSLDLGAPVGEIITADWDGDGHLELSVVTEDGHIRGIDSYTAPSPTGVIDIDPRNLDSDSPVDIDRLISSDQLAASWDAVEGAVAYEVAVFTMAGQQIKDFTNVGSDTKTRLSNLPLVSDTRYQVAVRAIDADSQPSVDVASDGVVVIFADASSSGGGDDDNIEPECANDSGGCGCQIDSQNRHNTGIFALFLSVLVIFRGRKVR